MYDTNKRKKLKDDMMEELYGAAFVGGFGGALLEADEIDDEDDDELEEHARRLGIDPEKYNY